MKYLIVALGNIGDEYADTRHNIGFSIADKWALSENAIWRTGRLANVTEIKFKGRTAIIIKPTTYMNLSGKAVNYWMQAEKIPIQNILVLTDDLALPYGSIRLKSKGSDGGHNGLKDIQATLNTPEYSRLRFGIGSEFSQGKQVNYVLGKWSAEESVVLKERITIAIEAIKSFLTLGIEKTMTAFNKK